MQTLQSRTALRGFRAEAVVCSQESARRALEQYFQRPIQHVRKGKHRTKTDIVIEFEDVAYPAARLQMKNGDGAGRGFSIDRRPLNRVTTNPLFLDTLSTVCLGQPGQRVDIPGTEAADLIRSCVLGEDADHSPTHILHTALSSDSTAIEMLSICTADTFVDHLQSERYPILKSKRTCVHLSPSLYLQRKGGGSRDAVPNDIQTKLRWTPHLQSIFTPLPLNTASGTA